MGHFYRSRTITVMAVPLVLVHGGGHGAWCWAPTLTELTTDTLAVDLPPLSIRGGPGRHQEVPACGTLTLADWAAAVLEAATAAGWDRFVLAGHSLGGATIAEVARRAPARVARLVYVSAVVPAEGGSVLDMLPSQLLERFAGGMTDDAVREMFCTGMDQEQTRFVLDHVGTELLGVLTEAVSRRGTFRTMPVTFLRLARDNALPPATQDACIDRLRAEVDTVDVIELDTGSRRDDQRPRRPGRRSRRGGGRRLLKVGETGQGPDMPEMSSSLTCQSRATFPYPESDRTTSSSGGQLWGADGERKAPPRSWPPWSW
jgi:pimeloyl-ACP methyl ester carboxylesterase